MVRKRKMTTSLTSSSSTTAAALHSRRTCHYYNGAVAMRLVVLFLFAALIAPPQLAAGFSAVPSGRGGPRRLAVPLQVSTSTGTASSSSGSGSVGSSGDDSYKKIADVVENQSQVKSSPAKTTTTTTTSSSTTAAALPWNWQAVVDQVWKDDLRPIIMFDGECNLCNGGVNMLLDMDTNNEFRFCSLSSKFGQSLLVAHGKDPDDRNSIMVIVPKKAKNRQQARNQKTTTSRYYEKSRAVLSIASRLGGAPSWVKSMTAVGTVAPVAVSDWMLQVVADHRHRIHLSDEYDQCRLDLDGEYEGRFLNDHEHEELFQTATTTTTTQTNKAKNKEEDHPSA